MTQGRREIQQTQETDPGFDNSYMSSKKLKMLMKFHHSKKGFTLAELLIALVILGVIATFAITKILQDQETVKRKSILKTTITALGAVAYKGKMVDRTLSSSNSYNTNINYFFNNMNPVKICSSNVTTQGCWPSGTNYAGTLYAWEETSPGMVLANGAVIVFYPAIGINATTGNYLGVDIDWNGSQGPNAYAQDVMLYYIGIDNDLTKPWTPGTIKACCDPVNPASYYVDFW